MLEKLKMIQNNIVLLKYLLKKKMEWYLKKKSYTALMEEKELTPLVIGSCLPSFTTVILLHQSTVGITVGKITLLNRSEKCV